METNIDRLELLPAEPAGPDPALACPTTRHDPTTADKPSNACTLNTRFCALG
jgi:hypothetical protein